MSLYVVPYGTVRYGTIITYTGQAGVTKLSVLGNPPPAFLGAKRHIIDVESRYPLGTYLGTT